MAAETQRSVGVAHQACDPEPHDFGRAHIYITCGANKKTQRPAAFGLLIFVLLYIFYQSEWYSSFEPQPHHPEASWLRLDNLSSGTGFVLGLQGISGRLHHDLLRRPCSILQENAACSPLILLSQPGKQNLKIRIVLAMEGPCQLRLASHKAHKLIGRYPPHGVCANMNRTESWTVHQWRYFMFISVQTGKQQEPRLLIFPPAERAQFQPNDPVVAGSFSRGNLWGRASRFVARQVFLRLPRRWCLAE